MGEFFLAISCRADFGVGILVILDSKFCEFCLDIVGY
jgi:hypothetical protein